MSDIQKDTEPIDDDEPCQLLIKTLTGYNDRDVILEHAVFQILDDFIERECSNLYNKKEDGSLEIKPCKELYGEEELPQWATYKELGYLLNWWRLFYLPYFRGDGCSSKSEWEAWYAKKESMRTELTEKMKRLVELRGNLWT